MEQIKQTFNMVKLFKFEADVVQAAVDNGLEIALGTLNDQLAEFAAGTPDACSACDAYAATIAPYKNNISPSDARCRRVPTGSSPPRAMKECM